MTDAVLRNHYLNAMGIDVWVRRDGEYVTEAVAAVSPTVRAAARDAIIVPHPQPIGAVAALDWDGLAARVAGCTLCELHTTRTQTVFGVGNRNADWLVIGEAPGADEDQQGEPFVGRAGQLLNAMLFAIGLQREQVYIANILKCRPPNNRDPAGAEVACCEPYLFRQIELLQPKIILAVGRIAAQNLLKTDTPIGKLRGQLHHYGPQRIPVVVTYHPAYLLRSPSEKRKAWDDLRFACKILREAQ
jgi:uracil-DNA glycosylase family 4